MFAQAQDGSGETPIDVAKRYRNVSAAKLLSDALHFPSLRGNHDCASHARSTPASRRGAQQLRLV